jgi:hypothetical protein
MLTCPCASEHPISPSSVALTWVNPCHRGPCLVTPFPQPPLPSTSTHLVGPHTEAPHRGQCRAHGGTHHLSIPRGQPCCLTGAAAVGPQHAQRVALFYTQAVPVEGGGEGSHLLPSVIRHVMQEQTWVAAWVACYRSPKSMGHRRGRQHAPL